MSWWTSLTLPSGASYSYGSSWKWLAPPAAWGLRYLDDHGAAGRRRLDSRQYPTAIRPYRVPMVRGQHDERQPPPRQVLLIADILVAGDKHLETSFLGGPDQVAIREASPAYFRNSVGMKAGNESANADRNAFVKQDAAHWLVRARRRGCVSRGRVKG